MLAVYVMRMCASTTEPEPRTQGVLADDDDTDATADVLGCVRAKTRAPSQETDPEPGDDGAMRGLTATERRNTALRMGYAACLLPG